MKLRRTVSNMTPGPKYTFQTTLDDRNKVLSQHKKRGTARFVLPSSKSRLQTEYAPSSASSLVCKLIKM